MNWLTQAVIQHAASLGRKEAYLCSEHHWWQIRTAGWEEYYAARECGLVGIHSNWCALCIWGMWEVGICDMWEMCRLCELECGVLWRDVFGATDKPFGRAAAALHKHIKRKIRELYPGTVIPRHEA
jgi:hypothetical protein